MREFSFRNVSPPELDGIKYFGDTEEDVAHGFSGRIHDAPVGHSVKGVFEDLAGGVTADFYSLFDIWIVPHRVSIIRRQGLREVVSVGCQVQYEMGKKTCSVVSLLPAAQFVNVASMDAGADLKLTGVLSQTGQPLMYEESISEKSGVIAIGPLALSLRSKASLELNFSARVFTPHIAAVGVGSTQCEFRFDVHEAPLFNRDIETWAFVALPKRTRELKYKIKYYFVSRLAFVPSRFESDWLDICCIRGN